MICRIAFEWQEEVFRDMADTRNIHAAVRKNRNGLTVGAVYLWDEHATAITGLKEKVFVGRVFPRGGVPSRWVEYPTRSSFSFCSSDYKLFNTIENAKGWVDSELESLGFKIVSDALKVLL